MSESKRDDVIIKNEKHKQYVEEIITLINDKKVSLMHKQMKQFMNTIIKEPHKEKYKILSNTIFIFLSPSEDSTLTQSGGIGSALINRMIKSRKAIAEAEAKAARASAKGSAEVKAGVKAGEEGGEVEGGEGEEVKAEAGEGEVNAEEKTAKAGEGEVKAGEGEEGEEGGEGEEGEEGGEGEEGEEVEGGVKEVKAGEGNAEAKEREREGNAEARRLELKEEVISNIIMHLNKIKDQPSITIPSKNMNILSYKFKSIDDLYKVYLSFYIINYKYI